MDTQTVARRLSIREIIDDRLVRSVFQPLVDLDSGGVVAYEALSRGPAGSDLESPDVLLREGRRGGRLAELDALCQSTALAAVRDASWPYELSLFLNVEPSALGPSSVEVVARARRSGINVVMELTERHLATDVATLLAAADRVRAWGVQVALDDVGVEPASLALIPLLRPDVVKLDMGILRSYSAGSVAETANAIRAYAEESGASVVAEGVETSSDVAVARVLGATIGQGWFFGRPGALPVVYPEVSPLSRNVDSVVEHTGRTPFEVVSARRPVMISTKALLLPISRTLERRGLAMAVPPLLLAAFQDVRHFTPATRVRYAQLAERLPLVAALGSGIDAVSCPGVRGSNLVAEDPLTGEWTVIVLGAHFAGALVARDLGDDGPDIDRRFSYAVTHDRSLVIPAARTLIDRIAPQSSGPEATASSPG